MTLCATLNTLDLNPRSRCWLRRAPRGKRCQAMVQDGRANAGGGWWRLTASILAVVSATVGFGYYLPLRQANQLLGLEFEKHRRSYTELSEQLSRTSTELATVTTERDALKTAKANEDEVLETSKEQVRQLASLVPATGQPALKSGVLKLTNEPDALIVDVFEKTWITPGVDGLTRNGSRVLCPLASEAGKKVKRGVVIRSFAPDTSSTPGESRWAAPGRLGSGVAESLVARCKVEAAKISVATSPATSDSPLLRLEFRL